MIDILICVATFFYLKEFHPDNNENDIHNALRAWGTASPTAVKLQQSVQTKIINIMIKLDIPQTNLSNAVVVETTFVVLTHKQIPL